MDQGRATVGFEAMPQIADLEIAATWDEIELEAALRSHGATVREALSAEPPSSSLADTLRTIEALRLLPRDERKRRAEDMLRALTSAPPASTPAPESAAPTPVDVSPNAEPVAFAAETSVAMPAVSGEPDALPKFLTTEYATLELEHPDSLIPFRAAAAAGALIAAVLLIYVGSSREFGVAARPILGASDIAQAHGAAPKPSASLAARQAFVAPPPDDATDPEPGRPHRPALVGFDFLDDPAPAPIAVKADTAAASPVALVLPPASTEETAALPPPPTSEIAALIKRGDDLLKAGDIAAARSAYERAAAAGSAKAEIGVGKTYDPLVLAKLGARGVRGDPVQAAAWYARAGEAGDAEGQQRLHALISGLSDCMLAQGTCANRKP